MCIIKLYIMCFWHQGRARRHSVAHAWILNKQLTSLSSSPSSSSKSSSPLSMGVDSADALVERPRRSFRSFISSNFDSATFVRLNRAIWSKSQVLDAEDYNHLFKKWNYEVNETRPRKDANLLSSLISRWIAPWLHRWFQFIFWY